MKEKWSPNGTAEAWSRFKNDRLEKLAFFFTERRLLLNLFLIISLGLSGAVVILTARADLTETGSLIAHSAFKLTSIYVYVGLFHVLASTFFYFVPAPSRKLYWLTTLPPTVLLATGTFRNSTPTQTLICAGVLLLEFLTFVAIYRLSRTRSPRTRLAVLFAGGLMLDAATAIVAEHFNFLQGNYYFSHTRWFMVFSYLILEEQILPKLAQNSFFSRFSPTNFLDPVPARLTDWQSSARPDPLLILKGWFDLLSSFVAICVLTKLIPSTFGALSWSWWGGAQTYVTLFLVSYVTIVIPVGILRLYGFHLKDAFELPLLAASPQDRWRRWNTYYYHWFYSMVFWPIFKRSRNLFLSCIIVFLVTYWFHASHLIFMYRGQSLNSLLPLISIRLLEFFMGHALAVYIGIRFHRFWPTGNKLYGWLGVLMTWLMMTLVHMIKW